MSLRLDIEEEGKRRAVEIEGRELTIGRGSDNTVVINDPRSSRRHCRLVATPQGVLLEDLDSRNGTIFNGAPVKKSLLKPGSQFLVGNVRFRILTDSGGEDTPVPAGEPAAEAESIPGAADSGDEEELLLEEVEDHAGKDGEEDDEDVEEDVEDDVEPPPRPQPAEKAAKAARPLVSKKPTTLSTSPRHGAYLECLEGEGAGSKLRLEKDTFLLGRGKDCDAILADKRASGHHARITREGDEYWIEDLGSTNGTLLNRRPVKKSRLAPGAVILIGSTSFRAQVPGTAAPSESAGSEDFVAFNLERFLERDRSQHPAAVAALVVILVIVGYFTVDITRSLAEKKELDPRGEANLITENWSFEEAPPEGSPASAAVPGWRLGEGDQGTLQRVKAQAQHPGEQALVLRSTGGQPICRATSNVEVILTDDRAFRLEGYAQNLGAFAAGLLVEWLRPGKEGTVEVGRAFSDTARQSGEAVDVNQVVVAPPMATRGRLSCFVIGSGAAAFDRIALRPESAAGKGPAAPGEGEPAAGEPGAPGEASTPVLRAGPREDPLVLTLLSDGLLSASRKKRVVVPAFWAGLGPDEDPRAYGPRLAAIRRSQGDAIIFDSEVPDEKEAQWLTVGARTAASGDAVQVEWKTAASPGEGVNTLWLYMETRDKAAPVEVHAAEDAREPDGADPALKPENGGEEAPPPAEPQAPAGDAALVRELVFGEAAERVSFLFPRPVRVSKRTHPWDAARTLIVVEGASGGVETVVSAGSRQEASQTRALAREAEEQFRAGRVGNAVRLLDQLRERHPEEKVEAEKAAARIEEWKRLAAAELKGLEEELAALRQTPSPVIEKMVVERAAALQVRYEGIPESDRAARVLQDAKGVLAAIEARREEESLRALADQARKHLAAGKLGVAELLYRWVIELAATRGDAGGQLRREAESALKTIEGRQARDRNILLQ